MEEIDAPEKLREVTSLTTVAIEQTWNKTCSGDTPCASWSTKALLLLEIPSPVPQIQVDHTGNHNPVEFLSSNLKLRPSVEVPLSK